ncbi:MAG TPA: sugar ABC transporter ATP-binding protein [Candidatus Angelobacter sp.]|nr:sugar ABC transporter ATP-binding protein [Candidatus Angelobacter sp.]
MADLLKLEKVSKSFNDVTVLNNVSLHLKKGEILSLVGGNGAGKSTLMKIITGLYRADQGSIFLNDVPVQLTSPAFAHKQGIYLVPQEPLIFKNMTIQENLTIGVKGSKEELLKKIKSFLEILGWELNIKDRAITLSIAGQQLVEILRGLMREAKILILDEPTSTLTLHEIDSLFKVLRQLRENGLGMIYITHRFSEVFNLSDRVAVLSDGEVVAEGPIETFTYDKLTQYLIGKGSQIEKLDQDVEPVGDETSQLEKTLPKKQAPVFEVRELCGKRFRNIIFDLFPGEVLGLSGVVGAGRTELATALFGIDETVSGDILFEGHSVSHLSVSKRIEKGLIYVPEDRHRHGVFLSGTVEQNISSSILNQFRGGMAFPFKKEKEKTLEQIMALNIKCKDGSQEVGLLSGGNQQKVVLGKALLTHPKVIILDEPTRGIDVNARKDIYDIINQLKKEGLAVILISSDSEEISSLSDRVLVMHRGEIKKEIEKAKLSIDVVTSVAFGGHEEGAE